MLNVLISADPNDLPLPDQCFFFRVIAGQTPRKANTLRFSKISDAIFVDLETEFRKKFGGKNENFIAGRPKMGLLAVFFLRLVHFGGWRAFGITIFNSGSFEIRIENLKFFLGLPPPDPATYNPPPPIIIFSVISKKGTK